MEHVLNRCQVFTPKRKVTKILNLVGYKDDILNCKIMENSFGEGNFLIEIVNRYITTALKENWDKEQIRDGLMSNIYGNEIDKILYDKTIDKLNKICKGYGIMCVEWQLRNIDTLFTEDKNAYDYIVGNPPYISYHQLDKLDRAQIKENYIFCEKGLFDIYYAFIEWALNHINQLEGKICYIVPNGVFKNKSAKALRDGIVDYLVSIDDYKRKSVFKGKLTTVTILNLDMKNSNTKIEYRNSKVHQKIERDYLRDNYKWDFSKKKYLNMTKEHIFGDYFDVKNTIATLRNNIFVLRDYEDNGDTIKIGKFTLEKGLLYDAVSIKTLDKGVVEKIIFPYIVVNRKVVNYKEDELNMSFPKTMKYLRENKQELENRNIDKNVSWFEYGRTQSLNHVIKDKILIPRIYTHDFKIRILNKNIIPYNGIIVTRKRELSLDFAVNILSSDDFQKYIRSISNDLQGESVQISTNDIKKYSFEMRREK